MGGSEWPNAGEAGTGLVEPDEDAQRDAEERAREEYERRAIARRRAVRSVAEPGTALAAGLRDDDPGVRRAALSSPHCTLADRLHAAQHDPDPSTVAWAVSLIPSYRDIPTGFAASAPWQARIELFELPDCPIELRLQLLLDDPTSVVRQAVARRKVEPQPEDVRRVLRSGPSHWAVHAAQWWDCFTGADVADFADVETPEALVIIASRAGARGWADLLVKLGLDAADPTVRVAALRQSAFPAGRLAEATRDTDERVRLAVLGHPAAPAAVVGRLADDERKQVRIAAVKHAACPTEVLARVAERGAGAMRRAALGNPGCPVELLEQAIVHSDIRTQLAALRAAGDRVPPSAVFDCLLRSHKRSRTSETGQRRRWQVDVCEASAASLADCARTRWPEVAALPVDRLPREYLTTIVSGDLAAAAGDHRPAVRVAAASHDEIPLPELRRLASDPSDSVRAAVAGRRGITVEIQRLLIVGMPPKVGEALAAHMDLVPEVAAELAIQGNRRVKFALIARPDATVELLRTLLRDGDEAVRAAVSRRLMELFGG